MGKAKTAAASEKKLAKKLAQQLALQKQNAIKNAYANTELFSSLKAFSKFDRNGLTAELKYLEPKDITAELQEWITDLLKSNMQQWYGDEWKTAVVDKQREMMDDDARYVMVYATGASDEDQENAKQENNGESAGPGSPIAFLQYRFVLEEEVEVLYVYELQLTEGARRKGLGKFLMQVAELLARKAGMKGVMLTVQRTNKAAMTFYQAIKYEIDDISPIKCDPLAPPEDYSYEILSKIWDKDAKELLGKRAGQARSAWAQEYDSVASVEGGGRFRM